MGFDAGPTFGEGPASFTRRIPIFRTLNHGDAAAQQELGAASALAL